jgi:hypothetical protein
MRTIGAAVRKQRPHETFALPASGKPDYQTLNPGEDFRPTHCGFSGKVGGGIPGSGFGFGFGFCLGVGGGSGISGAGIGGSGS